jgi:hypothetical protein
MSQADSVHTTDPFKHSFLSGDAFRPHSASKPTERQIALDLLKTDIGWLEQPSKLRPDAADWADHLEESSLRRIFPRADHWFPFHRHSRRQSPRRNRWSGGCHRGNGSALGNAHRVGR